MVVAVVAISLVTGCRGSSSPGSSESEQADENSTAAPGPGMKRFSIDPDKAASWGLPPVRFTLDYPEGAKVNLPSPGQRNSNYFEISVSADKRFLEILTLGRLEVTLPPGGMQDSILDGLLDQIQRQAMSQFPGTKLADGGKYKLGKYESSQRRLIIPLKDESQGIDGDILMIMAVVLSPKTPDTGVLALLQASHHSDIQKFDDFGVKGTTGQVWQSLRFE